MIRKDGPKTHSPSVQNAFMTETTQTGMAMNNFNLLPDDDVSENGEARKDCRHGRLSINDQKGDVVNFKSVRQVVDSGPSFVGMSDDDDFVTSVNELRR